MDTEVLGSKDVVNGNNNNIHYGYGNYPLPRPSMTFRIIICTILAIHSLAMIAVFIQINIFETSLEQHSKDVAGIIRHIDETARFRAKEEELSFRNAIKMHSHQSPYDNVP